MFSAFSFGKIIKTILPGAILTAGLLMLIEAAWGLWHPGSGLLIGRLNKDWITSVSAALIPVSLILGFFLNTFAWMAVNPRVRARCDAELAATLYPTLRQKLTACLWAGCQDSFGKLNQPLGGVSLPRRQPLEYYFLPTVTLTHLNYLWESYFCWYEFDINSACAILLSLPGAGFLLWVKLQGAACSFLLLMLLLLVLSGALCLMLARAAVRNLVAYEKNLLLLITGSLANAANSAASSSLVDDKVENY